MLTSHLWLLAVQLQVATNYNGKPMISTATLECRTFAECEFTSIMMTNQFGCVIYVRKFHAEICRYINRRSTEQLWELLLISLAVTYSRAVTAICGKQIGARPFQVQQAWHARTVSIWMIQHNSSMSLAALSLMAVLQLFVYSWWVSLNQNQKTHPVICQVPLSVSLCDG